METVNNGTFKVGGWSVEPCLDRINQGPEAINLRPQVMELLVYLTERAGQVVSTEELLRNLWPQKVVTSGSVYNCVAELRHALATGGDRQRYIETIPKRGYRLLAPVAVLEQTAADRNGLQRGSATPGRLRIAVAAALLLAALAAGFFAQDRPLRVGTPADQGQAAIAIAVLPFIDLSAAGDLGYFADGIAEELLNSLARVRGLRVISRSSAFALRRNVRLSIAEVAERLQVTYVLEGAVRTAGDRIRITAQVVDARHDSQLWSGTYDGARDDIFAIQDEIASRVVAELSARLRGSAPVARVTDPEALTLFFRGRYEMSQRSMENLQRAEGFFEQAIAIDPGYSPAHAGLATALILRAGKMEERTAVLSRAKAALDRALELDPENSQALAAMGLWLKNTDPVAAPWFYQQAISYNNSNSDAYRWLALHYGQSDPPRYLELMQQAYLVDPLVRGLNFHRVAALFHFGRYDEALSAAGDWHQLNPAAAGPYAMAGMIYVGTGQPARALQSYFQGYRREPEWDVSINEILWLLINLDELELAESWSRTRQEYVHEPQSGNDRAVAVTLQAALSALRGHRERARRLLRTTEVRHPEWSPQLGREYLMHRDFQRARRAWEHSPDWSEQGFKKTWEGHRLADYALSLAHTGAIGQAEDVMDRTLDVINTQLEAGMAYYAIWSGSGESLLFLQASLYAMRGDANRALAALRDDRRNGLVSCATCLRRWPHFDRIRDDPAFAALMAEQAQETAARRDRLAARGLLLTPREVLQLDGLSFDPFLERETVPQLRMRAEVNPQGQQLLTLKDPVFSSDR